VHLLVQQESGDKLGGASGRYALLRREYDGAGTVEAEMVSILRVRLQWQAHVSRLQCDGGAGATALSDRANIRETLSTSWRQVPSCQKLGFMPLLMF
jgi:hypothetical protein